MEHFYYSNSCSEFSANLLGYLCAQPEYFKPFLGADCKIGLILVEADMNDLLFFWVHFIIYQPVPITKQS